MVYTGDGFIAVAYREAAAQEREKLEKFFGKKLERLTKKSQLLLEKAEKERVRNTHLTIMRSWHKGFTADTIAAITDLPQSETSTLIASFEDTKTAFEANPAIDFEKLKAISKLDEVELTTLLALLQQR